MGTSQIHVGERYTETSTTKLFTLGAIAWDDAGNAWQYVQCNSSTAVAVYDAVKVDDDFTIASLTTTISGSEPTAVGVAQIAFATSEYGWVLRMGKGTVNAAASCAQDVKLYTTGTAGVVDDSATDLISGLKIITTITSAAATPFYATEFMCTNNQD